MNWFLGSRPPTPLRLYARYFPALSLGGILGGIAACGAASVSTEGVPPLSAETQPVSQVATVSGEVPCLTWADYQTQSAALGDEAAPRLQMPPGFERGCVFRAGMGMGTPLYILPNGQPLSTVADPDLGTTSDEDPIPWFSGDGVDLVGLDTQVEQGRVLAYFFACTTQGAFDQNCAGFPQTQAYLIASGASCFQGFCLQATALAPPSRLALWTGEPGQGQGSSADLSADLNTDLNTDLSVEQRNGRQGFRTVAIDQFFPEPLVMGLDPEAIALAALGRRTLQEGEEPTQVETLGVYQNYLVVVVTNFGQADDSVGGQRYRLEFTYADNDRVILTWMGQQQYCRRSDPPAWSSELCP